jgi:hypothetical protein
VGKVCWDDGVQAQSWKASSQRSREELLGRKAHWCQPVPPPECTQQGLEETSAGIPTSGFLGLWDL